MSTYLSPFLAKSSCKELDLQGSRQILFNCLLPTHYRGTCKGCSYFHFASSISPALPLVWCPRQMPILPGPYPAMIKSDESLPSGQVRSLFHLESVNYMMTNCCSMIMNIEQITVHLGRKPHVVHTYLNDTGGFMFSPMATSLSGNTYKCISGWINGAHSVFLPHRQSLQMKFMPVI